MWINNITIVAFVWGRYVVYIDQHKYIDLGLRPQSIYFCLVDITTYRPHTEAIKLYNIAQNMSEWSLHYIRLPKTCVNEVYVILPKHTSEWSLHCIILPKNMREWSLRCIILPQNMRKWSLHCIIAQNMSEWSLHCIILPKSWVNEVYIVLYCQNHEWMKSMLYYIAQTHEWMNSTICHSCTSTCDMNE